MGSEGDFSERLDSCLCGESPGLGGPGERVWVEAGDELGKALGLETGAGERGWVEAGDWRR